MKRTPLKRGKPLNKVSKKQKEKNAVWRKLTEEAKRERGDICEIRSPVCNGPCDGHHVEGRKGTGFTKEKLLLSCRPCNTFIEDHPEWARERGFKMKAETPVCPNCGPTVPRWENSHYACKKCGFVLETCCPGEMEQKIDGEGDDRQNSNDSKKAH